MKELFKFKYDSHTSFIFESFSRLESESPPIKQKRLFSKLLTTKYTEKDYVENYGNPLSEVRHDYVLLVIDADDNKVSLKLFRGSRNRKAFTTYFRKTTLCQYITVSKKTGDLYTGKIINYHKKKKASKTFKKNEFGLNHFLSIDATVKSILGPEHLIGYGELYHQMIYFFLKELEIDYLGSENFTANKELLKYYANKKGVKYPDNIWSFISSDSGKIKLQEIRRFKGKYVDAYMYKKGLYGKVIKKALHNCENVNIVILRKAIDFFGEDWVNQDYEFILYCLNSKVFYGDYYGYGYVSDLNFLTTSEKRRVFNFFKDYIVKIGICNFSTFLDHLTMIKELKSLGERDITWKATNLREFNEEHSNLTSKIEYHKKGFYQRIYPQKFSKQIEKPIDSDGVMFYPILIKDTDEYVKESCIQSNCVKTYIGNPGSYIISLRKFEKDSHERATIEFYLSKFGKDVPYFRVKQALGKFNNSLDDSWNKVIQILLGRFAKSFSESDYELVKIQKIFQNGKKLSSDTYWDDEGLLKWSSVDLTSFYG